MNFCYNFSILSIQFYYLFTFVTIVDLEPDSGVFRNYFCDYTQESLLLGSGNYME